MSAKDLFILIFFAISFIGMPYQVVYAQSSEEDVCCLQENQDANSSHDCSNHHCKHICCQSVSFFSLIKTETNYSFPIEIPFLLKESIEVNPNLKEQRVYLSQWKPPKIFFS